MLDFQNHKITIIGTSGSGKTVLVKQLAKGFKKPIVYRINADFDNENIYIYRPVDLYGEFNEFIKYFIENDYDLLILDDSDMFLGDNFEIAKYPEFRKLIIDHRHLNKTLILISKRPQNVPTKVLEDCKYTIWFKVGDGVNVQRKIKEISIKLYELMQEIKFQDYRFIIKPIGEIPFIHEKV